MGTLLTRVARKRPGLVPASVKSVQPSMGPGFIGSENAASEKEMLFIPQYFVITE